MSDYPVLSGIALTGFGGRPRVDDELAKAIREETTRLLASCARKDAALRKLLNMRLFVDVYTGRALDKQRALAALQQAEIALAEAAPAAGEPGDYPLPNRTETLSSADAEDAADAARTRELYERDVLKSFTIAAPAAPEPERQGHAGQCFFCGNFVKDLRDTCRRCGKSSEPPDLGDPAPEPPASVAEQAQDIDEEHEQ